MTTMAPWAGNRPGVRKIKANQYSYRYVDYTTYIGRCFSCGGGVEYYSGWILNEWGGQSRLWHRPGTCGKRTL
jgi:hypothetical protein